jgi:hypothetical protein
MRLCASTAVLTSGTTIKPAPCAEAIQTRSQGQVAEAYLHTDPPGRRSSGRLLWITSVFRIESKRIRGRRELFAAQHERGRIIAERSATRELLHLGQHRLG